jgi:ATP-dependent Clp protease protease subunit
MYYCPNPESDEPIFYLDKQIGANEKKPHEPFIDGDIFARELLEMDARGKKRIEIRINSEGGNVKQGMSIYGAILNTKTKVDTFCVGVAYSMAAVCFQGGRKRKMMDYAQLMYHNAYDPTDKRKKRDSFTDLTNESLNTMISKRSWKDESAVRSMMDKETFINSTDALNADLCDEVVGSDELNKPRLTATHAEENWSLANEYVNKFLSIKTATMTKEAKIALGLPETATDAECLAAINQINAEKATAVAALAAKAPKDGEEEEEEEDEDAEPKGKKSKKNKKEMKAMEDKLSGLENKLTAIAAAEEAAKLSAKKEAGKAKVLGIIASRKLTLDQAIIDNYVALAGSEDDTINKVVATLENMEVKVISAKKDIKVLNKKLADDTAFPLIPGAGEEKTSPTGVGAGDTKDFINHINSFDMLKYQRKGK